MVCPDISPLLQSKLPYSYLGGLVYGLNVPKAFTHHPFLIFFGLLGSECSLRTFPSSVWVRVHKSLNNIVFWWAPNHFPSIGHQTKKACFWSYKPLIVSLEECWGYPSPPILWFKGRKPNKYQSTSSPLSWPLQTKSKTNPNMKIMWLLLFFRKWLPCWWPCSLPLYFYPHLCFKSEFIQAIWTNLIWTAASKTIQTISANGACLRTQKHRRKDGFILALAFGEGISGWAENMEDICW